MARSYDSADDDDEDDSDIVNESDEDHSSGIDEDEVEDCDEDEDDEEENDEDENGENADDEGLTMDGAKASLRDALDGIEAAGDFATFGLLKQNIDPCILVDEMGPIRLPLTEGDAKRIIAKSHQAPFGRGIETIVDEAVRRTWELNVNQFYITNPAFWQTQQEALHAMCKGLGLEANRDIKPQLYKLLLYEKGALFRPHTDTEKVPGMFGTLVISVPSVHEGGDLVLSHRGNVVRWSSAKRQPAFGAWYSDVTHEVQEVTSGHRLVLTYNLVQRAPGAHVSATTIGQHLAPLDQALEQWNEACQANGIIDGPAIYLLEHKYTDASLKLQTLKGSDLARAQAIKHFAERQDVVLYLASMERYVSGCADDDDDYGYGHRSKIRRTASNGRHAITDEVHSSLKLTRVVDIDGKEVLKEIDINMDSIVQSDAFDDRDPDDEAFQGHTGNAGAEATHWYRDTVLVIIQRSQLVEFLLRVHAPSNSFRSSPKSDIEPLLEHYLNIAKAQPTSRRAKEDVSSICFCVISKNMTNSKYDRFSDEVVCKVIAAMTIVHDGTTVVAYDFADAVKCLSGAAVMSIGGFVALGAILPNVDFNVLRPALELATSKCVTVSGRLNAMRGLFGPELENGRTPETYGFIFPSIWQILKSRHPVTEDDGAALADISTLRLVPNDQAFFEEHILPLVLSNAANTLFAVSFLASWGARAAAVFNIEYMRSIHIQVWGAILPQFRIRHMDADPRIPTVGALPTGKPEVPKRQTSALNLAQLLEQELDSQQLVNPSELLRLIKREACIADAGSLLYVFVPFLRFVLSRACLHLDAGTDSDFRALYVEVLTLFLFKYVNKQPPSGGDWTRALVSCRCHTCSDLNGFLANAAQQVRLFSLRKDDRQHVHQRRDASHFDGTHETQRSYSEPQTLVVTKHDWRQQQYDAWLARCQTAHEELRRFDGEALKTVLRGAYDSIMAMKCVISNYATAPILSTPLPNGRQYDADGTVELDHWPMPNELPPPAPLWLSAALDDLRERYPDSDFESLMRPYVIDSETTRTVKGPIEPGDGPPPNCKIRSVPRIRCLDCPTKLYSARPESVVTEFTVHLRNRKHRDAVQSRLQADTVKAGRVVRQPLRATVQAELPLVQEPSAVIRMDERKVEVIDLCDDD